MQRKLHASNADLQACFKAFFKDPSLEHSGPMGWRTFAGDGRWRGGGMHGGGRCA
jgi:hypothetical protein